jgi:hypothetical protein
MGHYNGNSSSCGLSVRQPLDKEGRHKWSYWQDSDAVTAMTAAMLRQPNVVAGQLQPEQSGWKAFDRNSAIG